MSHLGLTVSGKRLLEVANRQFGVVTFGDLEALGFTKYTVRNWLRSGRLTRLHHQVYAYGHTALEPRGHWLAAVFACGPGAVLSHTSAAAFYDWMPYERDEPVHVTTTGTIKTRPGIVVHRVRSLDRADCFRPHPLGVTAIPRTFVDLADVLPWDDYRAIADAQSSLRLDRIREAQRRAPCRRGAPLVTRLIEADDAHTKSAFERRFLRFLDAHRLPRPDALNARVAGHKADCLYRERRLVVELDGRAFHRRRAQMRADRRRDTDYQLSGHRILRLVWDDLHPDEAARTAGRVRAMLACGS